MFHLQNIIPKPLLDGKHYAGSDIWGHHKEFRNGRRYLMTAPSGKGKSTLIHILYGMRNDFEGQLLIDEKDLSLYTKEEIADLRQNKISIVFQDLRLFDHLTGLENILLKSQLQGVKSEEEIYEMADTLGVSHLLGKTCMHLSYGQKQRIAIIRALCQPFRFLLLDEPFSHLDDENVRIATKLIDKECRAQDAGMVLVSLGAHYFPSFDKEIIL